LRNSNKEHLILAKVPVNNASFIDSQTAKFQLNLLKITKVTAAFVRPFQNTSVSSLCGWGHPQTPGTESF